MIPVAGLSAIGFVVSLFRTGRVAEHTRFFVLLILVGGFAVAVLRTLVIFMVALLRSKQRERNNKDSGSGQVF